MHKLKPAHRAQAMQERATQILTTAARWWATSMAAFIVGFFLIGPPFALARHMDGAAILLGALGLFSDFFALRTLLEVYFEKALRPVLALSVLQHLAAVAIGVVMLVQPIPGDWQPMDGTEHISDPGLAVSQPGRLIAVHNHKGEIRATSLEAGTVRDLNYTGAFGWETGKDSHTGIWIGGHQGPIFTREGNGWVRWDRPGGWLRSMDIRHGVAYVATQGKLYRGKHLGEWVSVRERFVSGVGVDKSSERVLAVGDRWWQSEDDGDNWQDVTPEGAPLGIPEARLSQGWRHVFEGGLVRGYLYSAPPDRDFARRRLPVTDLRVLLVNPDEGAEIWIASWGEGVWRSRDGGESWTDMGMQSAQIRAMAIDWDRRVAYVGPAHMVTTNGLFELHFEP